MMCSIAVRAYALVAVALSAATAHAVPVPWANPSGVRPGQFRWSNGQSDAGIFGSPRIGDYSFRFSPSNFRAVSAGGVPQTTSERVSFQVEVDSSLPVGIDIVDVSSIDGSYVSQNGGRLHVEMLLFVNRINQPLEPGTNPLSEKANTVPEFPLIIPTSQSGDWSAALNKIDLPEGWRRISIVLDMSLEALSVPGGTTGIWQSPGDITISFNIPEPATALTLWPLAAMRRRVVRAAPCGLTPRALA
jgi:hypothetical protein